jgi:mono/diheme cytochrome c family protein
VNALRAFPPLAEDFMNRSHRLSLAATFVASTSLVALAACSSNARTSSVEKTTGTAASGASLYATKCVSCHGSNGRSGSAGVDVAHEARDEAEDAIEKILEGGGGMPSFSNLSDQDVADLIAYLKTL